jgi:2-desacetyl-2-hydroxyethyl bacteriochlorophyllide A dehydrogenase
MERSTSAAVLEEPRRLRVVERRRPVPEPGHVVVRIAATAVCHTDLEIYTGRHPGVRYPVVMGHEATGVVDAIGSGVRRVRPGQAVLINPIISCGRCDSCVAGRENLCRNAGLLGRELDGTLASHVALPEQYVYALPAGLDLEAATLAETLATVRHAQRRAAIGPGDAVVVLGQGAAGLLHTQLARHAGAGPVIAVSRSGWKLDTARRFGADRVIDGRANLVDEVRDATNGRGADVVVDAAGDPAMVAIAIEMLRPGGRLLLYAVSHRTVDRFTTFPIYYKELTIHGSRALTAEDVEPAIALLASGAIDVRGFITASYPLTGVAAAFDRYDREPERVLRIVIRPER